jgi:hypothetical protein
MYNAGVVCVVLNKEVVALAPAFQLQCYEPLQHRAPLAPEVAHSSLGPPRT